MVFLPENESLLSLLWLWYCEYLSAPCHVSLVTNLSTSSFNTHHNTLLLIDIHTSLCDRQEHQQIAPSVFIRTLQASRGPKGQRAPSFSVGLVRP